jgi:PIN domain nuclease of toxin-antitoxin system
MIVMDSHIWFWWINLEHNRFPATLLDAIETAKKTRSHRWFSEEA